MDGGLLTFQIGLELWELGENTWVVALIKCGAAWLFSQCLQPFVRCTDYARLKCFPGRIFKTVRCRVTGPADHLCVACNEQLSAGMSEIKSSYLGDEFHLERKNGNMLHLNQKMCYYITDAIWYTLLDLAEAAPNTVFLRGYKEFSRHTATGSIMSLSDVLDSLILEIHSIKVLDNYQLLPVSLSVSDEKFLDFLNFLGVYAQVVGISFWIAAVLSITSSVFVFIPPLKECLYDMIIRLFCWAVHLICDKLRRSIRKRVYGLGEWVTHLHPSNDVQLRIVKSDISAIIGGGAKFDKEGATLVAAEDFQVSRCKGEYIITKTISCGVIDAHYPTIDIDCLFDVRNGKCFVMITHGDIAEVDCNEDEFTKLLKFLSCLAKNRSGSLESCDSKNKATVRRFRDSVTCYAKNGFPPVYELKLDNVLVKL